MRTFLLLGSVACFTVPAPLQARQADDTQRSDCRDKARQAIKTGRDNPIDRETPRAMRREYRRACRGRATR